MELKNPSVAKTLHNMIRVILYMLRKGMSKGKNIMDINTMMKRSKIAGKAINSLVSHRNQRSISSSSALREYEFSCSNSPAAFPFHINKKRYSHFFGCAQAPATEDDDLVTANAVKTALEMLHGVGASSSLEAGQSPTVLDSPWLPEFGRTPTMRQIRVTDSPFPVAEVEEDSQVDEAASEFINKFYRNLKKQDVLALEY